ncbi:MAG: hypothetical protein E7168_03735 [Firmicutes bacterium]|nr:hypothetical protein [Bacillota bacterium]
MNEEIQNSKKRLHKKPVYILLGILILIVIIIIVLNSLGFFQSIEIKRRNYLEKTGRSFYEDYYYQQLDELNINLAEFLSNFEKTGISIDLNIMIEKSFKTSKEIEKKLENCDLKKTKIIIYPQVPYGKKDYDFELRITCTE